MGRIKGLLSWHIYSKWESWKAALFLAEKGQKAAHQRKGTTDKKERTLTINSRCCCRREGWWWWRCRWMRTRHADYKSMWQCFGVWGLSSKSRFKLVTQAHTAGGELVLAQHLIRWSGNRQSTQHSWRVITRWPGALLEISQFFSHTSRYTHLLYIISFWLGKTTIARIDSQRYITS